MYFQVNLFENLHRNSTKNYKNKIRFDHISPYENNNMSLSTLCNSLEYVRCARSNNIAHTDRECNHIPHTPQFSSLEMQNEYFTLCTCYSCPI